MSTMFAALHGELVVHPWRARDAAAADAYSLFVARSSALGWLAEPGAPTGRWGMNDAGQGPGSRVAWFQVAVPEPNAGLPVQAFLACAGDVAARLGTLRLDAVQVLLPVRAPGPRPEAVLPLLQDAGWFVDVDPHSRTRVRVTLDGGQDPAIRTAAPELVLWTRELDQDVFAGDASSLIDDAEPDLDPGIIDELWNGPSRHRVAFQGALAEWSLDALGWLAAFLAQASARHGVGGPLMISISKAGGP